MGWREVCGLVVVLATLVGVAMGRYPWLRMNRATIALVGATLVVALGVLPLPAAFAAVDLGTLALLLGMMVLNTNLRLAGFFALVGRWVAATARTPRQLLALVILAGGGLSAVFLNDTMALMLTPLVMDIAAAGGWRPVPYLVALATAVNVGPVATLVGNPQNMLIGTASGISFLRFSAALAPVAAVGLAIVSILAGAPLPLAALLAASLLLVTRRLEPERVFREVDWSLLIFFAGLFVVTAALEPLGVTAALFALARPLLTGELAGGVSGLAAAGAVLSNLVSNVPAVLLLRPLVPRLPDPEHAWLVLAVGTTLAGNLTLLGSVANLIVAELARARGVRVSFGEYLKAGVPITLLTLAAGVAWLSWLA